MVYLTNEVDSSTAAWGRRRHPRRCALVTLGNRFYDIPAGDDSNEYASLVDDGQTIDLVSGHVFRCFFDISTRIDRVHGVLHDSLHHPFPHVFGKRVSQLKSFDDFADRYFDDLKRARQPVALMFWYFEESEDVFFRDDANELLSLKHGRTAYPVLA